MLRNFGKILPKKLYLNAAATSVRSTSSYVESKTKDGVREIILADIKTRNALSMNMMNALLAELCKTSTDEKLRCVVLSAKGSVFSAGHDLKELGASPEDKQLCVFNKLTDIITTIQHLPIPVIAKVNGIAAAAGCQLVASCDIIVATTNSQFSTPGANFGIFCSTPGIALTRIMPRTHAAYMLMTGNSITAKEAHAYGLVSVLTNEICLESDVNKVTEAIIKKSRAVIALGKQFLYRQVELSQKEAYAHGAKKMVENLGLPDGREGLHSFKEKREPQWSHKRSSSK